MLVGHVLLADEGGNGLKTSPYSSRLHSIHTKQLTMATMVLLLVDPERYFAVWEFCNLPSGLCDSC